MMTVTAQRFTEAWDMFQTTTGGIRRPQSEADYLELLHLTDELTDHYRISDERLAPIFDLLISYISDWEREHEPEIPDATPAQMLEFFMDQHGLSQVDLAREGIADQALLSKILNGKRVISKDLAKKLAERFHITTDVFL